MDDLKAVILKRGVKVRGNSSEPGDVVDVTKGEIADLEACDVLIRESFYSSSPEIKSAYDVFIDTQRAEAGLKPIARSPKGKAKPKNDK